MNRLTSVLLIGIAVLLVRSPAEAQERDISFSVAKSLDSGIHNPDCIATGDFNGDGHPDFAIANHFHDLAVFLGNGDGTFKAPITYSLDFYVQGCVGAGDFNNDLKLDLVVVGGHHGLALLTGRGDGTFNSPVYIETVLSGASVSLAVGDLNNGGNLDIFIGGNGSSEEVLGDGKGNFTEGPRQSVSGFSLALGDFNKDGKLDVATVSPFTHTLSVLLGDGDGTFQAPQNYDAGFLCVGVVAADFNLDGNLDLAVTFSRGILMFLGKGDGTFTKTGQFRVGPEPLNIIAADFNKDGNLDLATPDFAGEGVTVLTGQGDATCSFTLPVFPSIPGIPGVCQPNPKRLTVLTGMNPAYVATADFNNDGSLDLLVANYGDGTVSVALNEAGTFMDIDKEKEGWERDDGLTLRVTVEGSVLSSVVPTGTVVFKNGARVLGRAELKNGKASVTIEDLEERRQSVQMLYSGDQTFNPNEATVQIRSKSREKEDDRRRSRDNAIRDGNDRDNDGEANHRDESEEKDRGHER
jgi:VCBS repeat protein/Big-like domain-containing protein